MLPARLQRSLRTDSTWTFGIPRHVYPLRHYLLEFTPRVALARTGIKSSQATSITITYVASQFDDYRAKVTWPDIIAKVCWVGNAKRYQVISTRTSKEPGIEKPTGPKFSQLPSRTTTPKRQSAPLAEQALAAPPSQHLW